MRTLNRRIALPSVVLLAAGPAAADQPVVVDGRQGGATFDGVGAISGGGGNSRLLIDYPEPRRGRILDHLFKPGQGAALQILKVEIGGDTNSTDGAEPSHQHAKGDASYERGYEWWLMEEARKRNPAIKISALAWGAPGWLGSFWTPATITYLVDWLKNARDRHGITVDTIGGWNEKPFDAAWIVQLKAALVQSGLTTRIVAGDSVGWKAADTALADPAFAAAVDILGAHYPCGYKTAMETCTATASARAAGKPLWASESGSQDLNGGAAAVVRAINRGYLDAHLTAYLNWPLAAAIYPNLAYSTTGLLLANAPWSGHYELGKTVWACAHTTQFTATGWRYIDAASGYLGGDRASGSYVTLRAPAGPDYSLVVETTSASAPQTLKVTVTGGLSTGPVHVWASNFASNALADYFVQKPDLLPAGGVYQVTVPPGWVYSLSTLGGQGRGSEASGPPSPFPLPYHDDFEGYPPGKQPRYLSDMQGAFETVPCGGKRAGTCVRQMAPVQPIEWTKDVSPYAAIGDPGAKDYTVSAQVLWEEKATATLLARIKQIDREKFDGYLFTLSSDGAWSIVRHAMNKPPAVLASGTTTPPGTGSWHRLSLAVAAARLVGSVDGVMVGAASDETLGNGLAGVGTGGYQAVQFDDLDIEGSAPAPVDDGGARADAGSPPADAAGLDDAFAARDASPPPRPEPSADVDADSGGTRGGPHPPPAAGGCSCRAAGAGSPAFPVVVAVVVASSRRRRRR